MQARIHSYRGGRNHARHIAEDRPSPPEDHELQEYIAPNWAYSFDVDSVEGIDRFRRRIRDAEYAVDRIEKWSHILGTYTSYRNAKIAPHVAIVNMSAAQDCVNYGTKYCQVEGSECFAARNERDFPMPLHFRRKQEIIWSYLDPVTWAKAFRLHVQRKENDVTTIRLNEAGDFSSRHDILKVSEIARRLPEFDIYTYSASSWLEWAEADGFTVNRSNDGDYGHRRYKVVDSAEEIPAGPEHVLCPYDATDGEILCGDCKLCINEDGPDIYVTKFTGSNQ